MNWFLDVFTDFANVFILLTQAFTFNENFLLYFLKASWLYGRLDLFGKFMKKESFTVTTQCQRSVSSTEPCSAILIGWIIV